LPLPGIEPRLLGRPAHILVPIQIELDVTQYTRIFCVSFIPESSVGFCSNLYGRLIKISDSWLKRWSF
jgi:hypothetical protein